MTNEPVPSGDDEKAQGASNAVAPTTTVLQKPAIPGPTERDAPQSQKMKGKFCAIILFVCAMLYAAICSIVQCLSMSLDIKLTWIVTSGLLIIVLGGLICTLDSFWRIRFAGKTNIIRAIVPVIMIASVVMLWSVYVCPRVALSPAAEKFNSTLGNKSIVWVTYEPTNEDPDHGFFGDSTTIDREIQILQKQGFTGLITFTAQGAEQLIPEVAKRYGFRAVVMGVYHPDSASELQQAIDAEKYVDGYCVGHNAIGIPRAPYDLDHSVQESDILNAMQTLKDKTNKPVTTSLDIDNYRHHPAIAYAVDWFMPDMHYDWNVDTDVNNAKKELAEDIARIKVFRDEQYPNKLIQAKLLSFPTEGNGATPEKQAHYLAWCREYFDGPNRPANVYPSYFSAFDIPWKKPPHWQDTEMHVGLLDASGRPKIYLGKDANGKSCMITTFADIVRQSGLTP